MIDSLTDAFQGWITCFCSLCCSQVSDHHVMKAFLIQLYDL